MEKEELRFKDIINTYARPKIGELSINEKALAEYEKFCFDLINQLKKQKEIIDRAREYVKPLLTNHEDLNSYCILSYNKMILLEILEDKEV